MWFNQKIASQQGTNLPHGERREQEKSKADEGKDAKRSSSTNRTLRRIAQEFIEKGRLPFG